MKLEETQGQPTRQQLCTQQTDITSAPLLSVDTVWKFNFTNKGKENYVLLLKNRSEKKEKKVYEIRVERKRFITFEKSKRKLARLKCFNIDKLNMSPRQQKTNDYDAN